MTIKAAWVVGLVATVSCQLGFHGDFISFREWEGSWNFFITVRKHIHKGNWWIRLEKTLKISTNKIRKSAVNNLIIMNCISVRVVS